MSKFFGVPSLLYRRQILQENIRRKALDEIYKMYMLLQLTPQYFSKNCVKLYRILGQHLPKKREFSIFLIEFRADVDLIFSEF